MTPRDKLIHVDIVVECTGSRTSISVKIRVGVHEDGGSSTKAPMNSDVACEKNFESFNRKVR
jgi:hypothetical protein